MLLFERIPKSAIKVLLHFFNVYLRSQNISNSFTLFLLQNIDKIVTTVQCYEKKRDENYISINFSSHTSDK